MLNDVLSPEEKGGSALLMQTIVQVSLDLRSIPEALDLAHIAVDAGVDWLEAGTPLIISEGRHAVRALREAFPMHPIIADLKAMDGGRSDVEMMAQAGATHIVVMARAHPETIKAAVSAGREHNVRIMGDTLASSDKVAAARLLEDLGCDYVVHHIGFDERNGLAAAGQPAPSPLDTLQQVVQAVKIPVQAVGGLSVEQAARTPELGAPLVVIGAPLVSASALKSSRDEIGRVLRTVCQQVHAYR
jgi:3-hexulose-6-phosphate synthase/6-phospho-3-hexuloisomerase